MIPSRSLALIPEWSSDEALWEAQGPVLWSGGAVDLPPGHGHRGLALQEELKNGNAAVSALGRGPDPPKKPFLGQTALGTQRKKGTPTSARPPRPQYTLPSVYPPSSGKEKRLLLPISHWESEG